ncbi:hypothetical protein [Chitinophaga varians]|uniref:hypothetical protein n=1 Tax=Chitinophaga varians TaxID=2202339 RepID=UPI00165F4C42|nr:hypothetical protein [Chitinophaga varians]MBC9915371.1 hypothetical protein [Chitinophaga varians]
MISRFRIHRAYAFLTLLAVILLMGCAKEHSQEGPATDPVVPPANTAIYAVDQKAGACADILVTGTFKVGVAVAADAKIEVQVTVAVPGSWVLTTGKVNGMEFIGAGTFTAAGKRAITLIARGTPEKEGTFNFPLKTAGSSCNIAIKVIGDGPEVPLPQADFYYKLTANGKDYSQEVTTINNYMLTSETTGGNDVLLGSGVNWAGNSLPAGKTELLVAKGMLANFDAASNQDFKNFFLPGDYGYMIMNNQTFGTGVILTWTDENGKTWSTVNGTTVQPTGTFTIVSTEDWAGYSGYYGVKVKMRFSCKFYDETGATLNITNGEMVGGFVKKR